MTSFGLWIPPIDPPGLDISASWATVLRTSSGKLENAVAVSGILSGVPD